MSSWLPTKAEELCRIYIHHNAAEIKMFNMRENSMASIKQVQSKRSNVPVRP